MKHGERWLYDRAVDNAFVAEIVNKKYKIIKKIRGGEWYIVGTTVHLSSIYSLIDWHLLKGQEKPNV